MSWMPLPGLNLKYWSALVFSGPHLAPKAKTCAPGVAMALSVAASTLSFRSLSTPRRVRRHRLHRRRLEQAAAHIVDRQSTRRVRQLAVAGRQRQQRRGELRRQRGHGLEQHGGWRLRRRRLDVDRDAVHLAAGIDQQLVMVIVRVAQVTEHGALEHAVGGKWHGVSVVSVQGRHRPPKPRPVPWAQPEVRPIRSSRASPTSGGW